MSSLDRILPFLKPIEDLLLDPTITEVMVNEGGRRIFVEREGARLKVYLIAPSRRET
jgi:Flp pilus assembly CpaF family ATPase